LQGELSSVVGDDFLRTASSTDEADETAIEFYGSAIDDGFKMHGTYR
jgi:hypothetical protein